ncbi:CSLREA domain-containing protein [Acinetobacter gyllenbergii]|uniref:CSLREA domain-containing protein n=1 Tax=Acinetobacter gyllenbergii TaxID=134534 RepID=UPI000806D1F0|nr:CSLREA domain-containing protein [Acinetobacter gyllenbergii]OBY75866.1 membrane protein [Acinetobacter gyllenbergii]
MKHYKKTILATMMLATMPLLAATNNAPIKVTTFADEDGENANACSLREALKTAETRVAYGGCAVTDISSTRQKLIQLEKGVYTLKKELDPNVNVSIFGASPVDWEGKNVLVNDAVNQYPAQIELKTTIKAENSRIFNTTRGAKNLSLTNLILTGGRATDFGGAIYAGADVVLQSSQILDSQAIKEGGAIFMAGPSSTLTMTKSLIQGNKAEKGSVLSMGCMTDARYIQNNSVLTANSFVGNGSQNSSSMFEFCGEVAANISTNTIAKNIVNSSTGNLIKFTGDTKVGTDPNNRPSILSDKSKLELKSNTIVENTAFTTLLYDKLGLKNLLFNVIAYNGDSNSYACRYLFGNVADQEKVNFGLSYNAVVLKETDSTIPVNNVCDVPKESLKDNKTNLNVSNISITTLLSPMQTPSAYTAFMPMYYPKPNVTEVKVDDKTTKKVGLLDIDGIGCSDVDQRGLARITDGTLHFDPTSRNRCDIGSVELMQFKAGDLQDLRNISISNSVQAYQDQSDFFDNLVKNPNDPDFLTYYKYRLADYQRLLKSTKDNLHYRAIYIDLKNYQLPLPQDIEEGGKYKLQFFDPNLFDVKAEPLGKGLIDGDIVQIDEDDKKNLVCTWNNDLQQIIFYRLDDETTADVDKVFCKYTITSKSSTPGPAVSSSGLLKASFTNIAPVATDTSLTFKYQAKQKLSLNLLNFANDDGDTGKGGPGPEQIPNKPKFWKNKDGIELPIRLSEIPTKDLTITADRQGPCPEPDQKETCYGGNIYVQEVNAFNPFNFDFKYQVYDADGMKSNEAIVRTINTATTTDDTRTANGGGGGGSFSFYSVFGLFGLLAYRRFRK